MKFIKQTLSFTARNIKLFFRDKGTFISALIAPMVLLVLYILFLHGILKDSFTVNLGGLSLSDKLINGYIAAYEVSSILAVAGVTVAFIANMAMVDDRVTGVRSDLLIAPVKKSVLVLGYYLATAAVTLVICYCVMLVGFIYLGISGWAMSFSDCVLAFFDVALCVLFGTALSSVVCFFLRSRGSINAVTTIVSFIYGFICGGYYPISQFATGVQNLVMFLPGTYCTGLLRSHFMGGFYGEFIAAGMPEGAASGIMDSLDANMYFYGSAVPVWTMYVIVICSVLALVGLFVLLNVIKIKRKKKK